VSLPHAPFDMARSMVQRAERDLPRYHTCRISGCYESAWAGTSLCLLHYAEAIAELQAWGYSRRLKGADDANF